MRADLLKRLVALEVTQQINDGASDVLIYRPDDDVDALIDEIRRKRPGVKTIICLPDNGREHCLDALEG